MSNMIKGCNIGFFLPNPERNTVAAVLPSGAQAFPATFLLSAA